jgi:CheY-like chemotaxis protein
VDSKNSILIVDDEPALAKTLVMIFERAGYTAEAVFSGEEAMAWITDRAPSLVITDVIMPGMDGIELAKRVRESYPDCQILLFSGNAETQDLLEAAQQEGREFEILAKPVPPQQLIIKVASMLNESRPWQ